MQAYVVLDGGGVKGAALVGCLHALQTMHIEPIGFAGTSAGAIVAALSAAGYSPGELRELMVEQLEFKNFLDDGGADLDDLVRFSQSLSSGRWRRLIAAARCLLCPPRCVRRLKKDLGLYHAKPFEQWLLELLKKKLPALPSDARDVTFAQLAAAPQARTLKILATDVTSHAPAVFSTDPREYGGGLIEAIRASSSYPIVFKPVRHHRRMLADGGLCSNLPVFLFLEEHRQTGIPIIAFDLVSDSADVDLGDEQPSLFAYARDLMDTALEASELVMRGLIRDIHVFPVRIPRRFRTLDFKLSMHDRRALFESGAAEAFAALLNSRLVTFDPPSAAVPALRERYGPSGEFRCVLQALAAEVMAATTAGNVRSQIMLPTGFGRRIVVYHAHMDGDPDSDLDLAMHGGCTGAVWRDGAPHLANLAEAGKDPRRWGMTHAEVGRVRKDRKAMVAVPLYGKGENLIGTLAVDTDTALELCGWSSTTRAGTPEITRSVLDPLEKWATVICRMLS